MATQLRPTGIDELGDRPWGTHFCLFYESKEDLLDLLIPYLKAGLAAREYCLYVASEPVKAQEAERALREAVPNFERYLREGQIEIIAHLNWYLAGGRFDPLRVRHGWIDKLDHALAQGFAGMRFAANIFWLDRQDWQSFAEYEAKLDEVFSESRILGVCAYSLEQRSAPDMLDVVRHHQFTVVRRHRAWERLEGSELGRAHAEIRSLKDDLEHQVEERTAQLAAVNVKLTQEVGERQRSEEALRRSDDHLRLVVNTIPALVWSAQPDGTVDFINQRHQEFTGLSLENVKGWRWTAVIHPEDRARLVDQWRMALATGEALEAEARLRRSGGDYRWLVIRAVPLRDDSGKIDRWYGTMTDIEDRKQAVDALRQSESELREAQQVARMGNWNFDIGTNTVRWSEELYRIFDIEKADFGGAYESFLSRVHPDDRAQVLQVNAAARANGRAFELEYRIMTRNGQVKYIRVVGNARQDGAGAVSGLFGTAQDISERKLAEAAIHKSERVLREAESLGHTGSWEQDLLTGKIFNTDENLRLFFGDDRSKGTPFEDYSQAVHPDDREYVLQRHAQLLAEDGPGDIEFRVVWPDGSVHVLFGRAAVVRDALGQAIRVYGTNLDITDRKRAEEALRRSEDHSRLVIDTIPIMAWTVRPDGTVDYLNQRWIEYTGLSLRPYVAEPTRPIHPEDIPRVIEKWLAATAAGEAYEAEMRLQGADGEFRWFLVRTEPLRDESGRIAKWYGVSTDIDDRKRAEEEVNRQAARAETLVRIAARLNRLLDLEAVIHAICEEAVNTFKVSQASMSLYDPKHDLLVYAGGVNIPPEYGAIMEPITRARFEELIRALGPIMVVPDIQAVPDVPNVEFSSKLDVRTVVTVAMLRDQELIGALAIGVNGTVREFAQDELTLLKAVSDQAAQAIANAQLLKEANEQQEQLRALSAKLAEAQEAERRAVARELHDVIGQLLYAVGANLQAIQFSPDAVTLAGRLADSVGLVDEAIQQIRDLALELRPSMLDDFGLAPALTWLVARQGQRSGFQADFAAEPPDLRLPASLDTTVYRVVQIALTNVARHAQARHVTITIRRHGSELELLINDDGAGFDVAAALERARQGASLGLPSMQERVRLAGGTLEINSAPGQGTQIRAHFPIDQPGGP